jgi:hypothetical protein
VTSSPETVADLILNPLPEVAPTADDPEYISWFANLMRLVENAGRSSIARTPRLGGHYRRFRVQLP